MAISTSDGTTSAHSPPLDNSQDSGGSSSSGGVIDVLRQQIVETQDAEAPYSVFTRNEKCPLTSNIYFPAIPTLSSAFGKSVELINLTVTMYMVLQGLAPMLWGTLSDQWGRRPIYAACLTILSFSCVGLALVPTSDYWLLMVLRCLQAAGSASTIALGAGVIGDISTQEERGGFFGIFTLGPMVGPAIGPVIGGAIADRLGWRAIFWFLTIASSICLVILVLFMPETLRALVGNGSVSPPKGYRPLIPIFLRGRPQTQQTLSPRKVPQNPFRLFIHHDILILLAINAIICSVFYGVLATISTLFKDIYPFLNETTIGLCFLANGGGMIIGSSVNGWVLDLEYQSFKRREDDLHATGNMQNSNFPIEKARLRLLPIFMLLMAACNAGYGWSLQKKTNIAVPLILQLLGQEKRSYFLLSWSLTTQHFQVGYFSIVGMNSTSTLMIDLFPGQGSSITACNNLVRCTTSAVLVSVIQLIFDGIGVGWTYVLLCGITLTSIPLLYLEMKIGPSCQYKRRTPLEGNGDGEKTDLETCEKK